jgi:hypothetical protein
MFARASGRVRPRIRAFGLAEAVGCRGLSGISWVQVKTLR